MSSPSTRGICGCGDPSLFHWFLAWPAHALATGHSVVFSRDLFFPHGLNLLSNTSVLAIGLPLSPATWLFGPVFTENLALLLAVPFAVLGMDLLLRRLSTSLAARAVCSLVYGFSPYVLSSLTIAHLMTAWIGLLPLLVLGALDATSESTGRRRRGQWLLGAAVVGEFFVSTELLALSAIVAGVALGAAGASWLVSRRPERGPMLVARRLAPPLGIAAAILVLPALYALKGPRSLSGNVWGEGLNPYTGGTSPLDLVRPHATGGGLIALSGYSGAPMVQMQYLGGGLVLVAGALAVWRWRDAVSRTAAITAGVALVLCLSPLYVAWAPWRWLGTLPVLENVLQFRFAVFALLGALVVVARGVDALAGLGRVGIGAGALALAAVVLPIAIPESRGLPIRTAHVSTPAWWREAHAPAVVLAYPYPGVLLQSPLTWQAVNGFHVEQLGGSGPQGTVARAGEDREATRILDELSRFYARRPVATAVTAAPVREMIERHGVTVVVVPAHLHGRFLVTGSPARGAAAFFIQALGVRPVMRRGAWVFRVPAVLPAPRFASASSVAACSPAPSAARYASCVWEAGA